VQNCSICIENYCFKHKNLVGCSGLRSPFPTGGSAPWTLAGAPPPDPIIGSCSHARHGCVWLPLFFTLRGPYKRLCQSKIAVFPHPRVFCAPAEVTFPLPSSIHSLSLPSLVPSQYPIPLGIGYWRWGSKN